MDKRNLSSRQPLVPSEGCQRPPSLRSRQSSTGGRNGADRKAASRARSLPSLLRLRYLFPEPSTLRLANNGRLGMLVEGEEAGICTDGPLGPITKTGAPSARNPQLAVAQLAAIPKSLRVR